MPTSSRFSPGGAVKIPCTIQPGPFDDERLIEIETDGEIISGFVRSEYLSTVQKDHGFVNAMIIKVTDESIVVRIPGSFFTRASGITSVSPSWAKQHLQMAHAV